MKEAQFRIVRFRPDLGLEEFVNIGVLVYSPWLPKVEAKFTQNLNKAKSLLPELDLDYWKSFLTHLTKTFERHANADLNIGENVLQSAFLKIILGEEGSLVLSEQKKTLIPDTKSAIDFVFNTFVQEVPQNLGKKPAVRASTIILNTFRPILQKHHVWDKLTKHTVSINDSDIEFNKSWKNGIWHCYEILPLKGNEKNDQAQIYEWRGKVDALADAGLEMRVAFLTAQPANDSKIIDFARNNLVNQDTENSRLKVEFYTEFDAEAFAEREEKLMRALGH